jgi:hypothetical protein
MALSPISLARRKSGVQIPSPPPLKRQVRASSASRWRRSLHVAAALRPHDRSRQVDDLRVTLLSGRVQCAEAVTQSGVGVGVQVAVAVEGEADRRVTGQGSNFLGLAPAAIQSATAVCRRSWMRSPFRPAALVAGRQVLARKAVTRSGPPFGAVDTWSLGSPGYAR